MKFFFSILLYVCLAAPSSLYGQEAQPVDSLLAGLPCIAVRVDSLSAELEEKGIHQAALRDTIVHSLRDAGITVVDADTIRAVPGAPTLVLHVNALIGAGIDQVCYSIRLDLDQAALLVRDASISAGRVPTWSISSIGLYSSGWREELVKDVLRHTETFAAEFLAANPNSSGG